MNEQIAQLGIGGAAIIIIYLIVQMFMKHLEQERKDRREVLESLAINIGANTDATKGSSMVMHQVQETMVEVKHSLGDHNDFVRNYVREGRGGGADHDKESPIV